MGGNKKQGIAEVFEFDCPCGARVTAVLPRGGDLGVIHLMPTCAEFDRLNAAAYVAWVRRQYEGKKP